MTKLCALEFAPPDKPLPAPRVTTSILFSFAKANALEISVAFLASSTANGGALTANGA